MEGVYEKENKFSSEVERTKDQQTTTIKYSKTATLGKILFYWNTNTGRLIYILSEAAFYKIEPYNCPARKA